MELYDGRGPNETTDEQDMSSYGLRGVVQASGKDASPICLSDSSSMFLAKISTLASWTWDEIMSSLATNAS